MESVLLGNLLTVMIFLSLPAILPVVIKPYGDNRFGAPASPLSFMQAINTALRRISDFKGRASRSEFWWNALVYGGVYLALNLLTGWSGWSLILLLPLMAVGTRRLHDINRTGFWLIIGPLGLGAIALIVLLAWPSQKERA